MWACLSLIPNGVAGDFCPTFAASKIEVSKVQTVRAKEAIVERPPPFQQGGSRSVPKQC
jgi:hypothetical protein